MISFFENFNVSPAVHTDAPNNTMSFKRNWPGIGEMKGNENPSCMIPGVESKKVSVRMNVMIAPRLPHKEIFGLNDFKAINTPRTISTTPKMLAKPLTPNAG